MAIKFTVHDTPNPRTRKGTTAAHARAVCRGTYKLKDICELISDRSAISPAHVKGVLDSLAWAVGFALERGYHIELEDLGYFSPSLRTRQKDERKCSVEADGVNFRCSTRLKEKLKGVKLEEVKKRKTEKSPEVQKRKLLEYLKTNGSISPRLYAELMNCSRYKAQDALKKFVAEGILVKVGYRNKVMYLLPF